MLAFLHNVFVIGKASERQIPQDIVAAGKVSMVTLARNVGKY